MKFLYNWFKKILNTEKSAQKVSESQATRPFENIIVGKILKINKHPNADRLRLAKVDVGSKEFEVVCGASNIAVGQKVPVALIGAKLSNGIILKEVEIRGVKSCGMLCAEDELGLGENHNGIMILDEKAEIGMEFAKYVDSNN